MCFLILVRDNLHPEFEFDIPMLRGSTWIGYLWDHQMWRSGTVVPAALTSSNWRRPRQKENGGKCSLCRVAHAFSASRLFDLDLRPNEFTRWHFDGDIAFFETTNSRVRGSLCWEIQQFLFSKYTVSFVIACKIHLKVFYIMQEMIITRWGNNVNSIVFGASVLCLNFSNCDGWSLFISLEFYWGLGWPPAGKRGI